MHISVVIPYGGGWELLERQLIALTTEQSFAGEYEVVVSVNAAHCELRSPAPAPAPGSTDRPSFDPTRVRYVPSHTAPGPSGARNVGWRESEGDFVLFCDADDQGDASWIGRMDAAVEQSAGFGGRLEYELLN